MQLIDVYFANAADLLYELCKERQDENQTNISFQLPTYIEHTNFINSKPYAYWLLIYEDTCHGYVNLTHRNEIGIVLFKESRGKGIGERALRLFMNTHEPLPAIPSERLGKWLANINPENERSKRLFKGLGFQLMQETYAK